MSKVSFLASAVSLASSLLGSGQQCVPQPPLQSIAVSFCGRKVVGLISKLVAIA
jgi:hypothetical protein